MSFKLSSSREIPALNSVLHKYEHPNGMTHFHFENDSIENSFALSFQTPSDKSDGRAHILEHLVLCGSEKYPNGDPFFGMMRRSVQTFMNAMTYPYRTVYPFSSPSTESFLNLMDVYLDATFFPLLRKEDFMQEGWRYNLSEDGNKVTSFDGIVFNEMKGAMSSPNSIIWRDLFAVAFPDTPLSVNSGGEPMVIPSLSYEELVNFHKNYYHPSQTLVFSFGSIPVEEIHSRLSDVISRRTDTSSATRLEKIESNLTKEVFISKTLPPSNDQLIIGFVSGEHVDASARIRNSFYNEVLFGTDESPISQILDSLEVGNRGPVNFVDFDSCDFGVVSINVIGITEEESSCVKSEIMSSLHRIYEEKTIDRQLLLNSFRNIQIDSRKISQSTPQGLGVILDAIDHACGIRDLEDVANYSDPEFIDSMYEELTSLENFYTWFESVFISNQKRFHIWYEQDQRYFENLQNEETSLLAEHVRNMTTEKFSQIMSDNNSFVEKSQNKVSNGSDLPTLSIEDANKIASPKSKAHEFTIDETLVTSVDINLRGLANISVAINLNSFDEDEILWASAAMSFADSVGLDSKDWMEAASYTNQHINDYETSVQSFVDFYDSPQVFAQFKGSFLERSPGLFALTLVNRIFKTNFKDQERLASLIARTVDGFEGQLPSNGYTYVASELSSHFQRGEGLKSHINGIGFMKFLKRIAYEMESDPQYVVSKFENIYHKILSLPAEILVTGNECVTRKVVESIVGYLPDTVEISNPDESKVFEEVPNLEANNFMLYGDTPVNYCYEAWEGPSITEYNDRAAISLLCLMLKNKFLHTAIREKGSAYGAMAELKRGSIILGSYRDPRLGGTYDDFATAKDMAINGDWSEEDLHQAKLMLLSGLLSYSDSLIANEALSSHISMLPDNHNELRLKAINSVTLCDIANCGKLYFSNPSLKAAYISDANSDSNDLEFEYRLRELNID